MTITDSAVLENGGMQLGSPPDQLRPKLMLPVLLLHTIFIVTKLPEPSEVVF
jgi:hypothetical protein